jgi:hypothetical protein
MARSLLFAVTLATVFLAALQVSSAIPQFSALTGNRCSNCHVNPGGGGTRNELGWYSWYDVSVIPRTSDALDWLYRSDESNQYFGDKVIFGMDLRVQNTRGFAEGAERKTFPMQAALYAAYTPVKAVTLEGSFNLAALRQRPNTDTRVVYPGQRMGSYSALVRVSDSLPMIRTGLIRPSIGMRYDDHTMAPYSYANAGGGRDTYLAPDWAEYGAEVTYETLRWLTLQAGVFGSSALAQMRLPGTSGSAPRAAIDGNAPTVSARAVVWPRFVNDLVNTWVGGSYLVNGDFSIASGFVGVGLSDHVSVMADYTAVRKTNVISSGNVMAELMWQIYSPLFVYGRYEHYRTEFGAGTSTVETNAAVLGSQIFLLPYVELRPEYRIWDTALDGTSNRWNIQLHIFY